MENHDQARAVSRFGNSKPQFRDVSAKMLATILLALRGTVFLYQGQELGTPHPQNWKIEDYDDVETQEFYKAWVPNRSFTYSQLTVLQNL